jgi:hypothetical protein
MQCIPLKRTVSFCLFHKGAWVHSVHSGKARRLSQHVNPRHLNRYYNIFSSATGCNFNVSLLQKTNDQHDQKPTCIKLRFCSILTDVSTKKPEVKILMQVHQKCVSKSNSEFAKIFALDGHSVRKTDYCGQPRAQ